ncbi:MAG: hypothetical protein RR922_04670 [Clostridia bacterium]
MFIYNLKLNLKVVFVVLAILVAMFFVSLNFTKLLGIQKSPVKNMDVDFSIDTDNFSDSIRQIHEDIDGNIKKRVRITGFVFRMPDFKKNVFVCGRNILVGGEDKVAGILCELENAGEFKDGDWVSIYGEIRKGSYVSDMPIIKIKKIEKIAPYKDSYIPQLP